MANIIRNFIDSLHLADDDETDEEYEEYLMETNEKERRRELRGEKRFGRRFDEDEEDAEEVSYRPNTSNFSDLKRERKKKWFRSAAEVWAASAARWGSRL